MGVRFLPEGWSRTWSGWNLLLHKSTWIVELTRTAVPLKGYLWEGSLTDQTDGGQRVDRVQVLTLGGIFAWVSCSGMAL